MISYFINAIADSLDVLEEFGGAKAPKLWLEDRCKFELSTLISALIAPVPTNAVRTFELTIWNPVTKGGAKGWIGVDMSTPLSSGRYLFLSKNDIKKQ